MAHTHNFLFVSDLHLSEGIDPHTGLLSRNEDFFYDEAFARFLVYHVGRGERPWKLFINGDFYEYLQVTTLPPKDHPLFTEHGIQYSDNKKRYGLGTSAPETVWKTEQIVAGHPLFFRALGWFLAHDGYELVLMKGNHDIEIFWPEVRAATRKLIAAQYADWHAEAAHGRIVDPVLPFAPNLPAELTGLDEKIRFPAWFVHEPDLFYVEHGNQYDPDNAFADFLNPVLPHEPKYIELPSGSFFVRYVFNKIEQLHPFADNIRPISRYINWAVSEQFSDTVKMLLRNPTKTFQAVKSLWSKRGKFSSSQPVLKVGKHESLPLSQERLEMLDKLRHKWQKSASEKSGRSVRSTIGSLIVWVISLVLMVLAVRAFVLSQWMWMTLHLALAGICFIIRARLDQSLQNVDAYVTLPEVSADICKVMNAKVRGERAAVRYHIFGHDHHATVAEINTAGDGPQPYRQWYVNTGSWLPSFSDQEQLTRGDVQLSFLRIMPDETDLDTAVPTLLVWDPHENRPEPVRILAPQEV